MSARGRFGTLARWAACFTLVLGAHAAAMALLDWRADTGAIASGPVILIDLAPAPAAPTPKQSEQPPGPQQPQAKAEPTPQPEPKPEPDKPVEKAELTPAPEPPLNKPVEKTEAKPAPKPQPTPPKPHVETVPAPPAPQADEVLTMLPPPRPHLTPRQHETRPRHRKPRRHASLASTPSAPSAAAHHAARPAAPAPGAGRRDPHAVSNWKSRLLARLERYKRAPNAAQLSGKRGVARLAFSIDRRGGVHNVRILHSSGSSLLDRATLALPRRAAPLPPPPAGLSGRRIPIVVPIRYNTR